MTRKELEALRHCHDENERGRELDCCSCAASQNCGSVACSAEPGELAALALRLADALAYYADDGNWTFAMTHEYGIVSAMPDGSSIARALLAELEGSHED